MLSAYLISLTAGEFLERELQVTHNIKEESIGEFKVLHNVDYEEAKLRGRSLAGVASEATTLNILWQNMHWQCSSNMNCQEDELASLIGAATENELDLLAISELELDTQDLHSKLINKLPGDWEFYQVSYAMPDASVVINSANDQNLRDSVLLAWRKSSFIAVPEDPVPFCAANQNSTGQLACSEDSRVGLMKTLDLVKGGNSIRVNVAAVHFAQMASYWRDHWDRPDIQQWKMPENLFGDNNIMLADTNFDNTADAMRTIFTDANNQLSVKFPQWQQTSLGDVPAGSGEGTCCCEGATGEPDAYSFNTDITIVGFKNRQDVTATLKVLTQQEWAPIRDYCVPSEGKHNVAHSMHKPLLTKVSIGASTSLGAGVNTTQQNGSTGLGAGVVLPHFYNTTQHNGNVLSARRSATRESAHGARSARHSSHRSARSHSSHARASRRSSHARHSSRHAQRARSHHRQSRRSERHH